MIRASLAYLAAGLCAVILAGWLATQIMPRAFSQNETKPAPPVAPPATPKAPPAVAAASAVPKSSPVAAPPAEAPVTQEATEKTEGAPGNPSGLLQGIIEDYNYVSEGKRDPFMPLSGLENSGATIGPMFPLQRFDLDQLKLVGIIWDVKNPKAMILDPQGKSYVVKVNERIGRNSGYVARIREGELVVVESFTGTDGKVTYQTRLVKLVTE
jgi:type IV pilus assembly protein PilP